MKKVFNRSNTSSPHFNSDGTFAKGHKPWNSGTKGLTTANKTSFKKGNLPENHTHVGAIKIRKRYNRNNPPIVWIKVAEPNKWEMLKRHRWKIHFGEIPPGMLVTHKDGNTLNCEVSNLMLITQAQNAMRNQNRKKAGESMKKRWALKRLHNQSINSTTTK